MNVSIIANGEVKNGVWLKSQIQGTVIAVDGGAAVCKKYRINPSYIIGDFDSVSKKTLAFFKKSSKIICNPDQHKTDLTKAIELSKKLNADHVFVFGALGNNLDHTISNMLSLDSHCVIKDEVHDVLVSNKTIEIIGKPEDIVSVVALTNVSGLLYNGLKWKAPRTSVSAGWIGVRNRLTKRKATITLKRGKLIVIKVKS